MKERIVFAGNSSIDNVITSDGVFHQGVCGGNCFHASMAASILSDKVAILANIPGNYPESNAEALRKQGIDTACLVRRDKAVAWNELFAYQENGDRIDGIFVDLDHDLDGKVLSRGEIDALIGSSRNDYYTYNDFRLEYPPVKEMLPSGWDIKAIHLAPAPLSSHLGFLSLDIPLKTLDPGKYLIGMPYADVLDLIRRTTVFIPSRKEMKWIFPDLDIVSSVQKLADDTGSSIVCKNGHDGCIVLDSHDGKCYRVGIYPEECIMNLTGAGDSFCGGLCSAMSIGYPLLDAARIATVIASKAIEVVSATDRNRVDSGFVLSAYADVSFEEVR